MIRREWLATATGLWATGRVRAGPGRQPPGRVAGTLRVLCVGIDKAVRRTAYDPGEHDARRVATVFRRGAAGPVETTVVGRADASRRGIVGGLKTVCGSATASDVVFIFVSTHGGNDRGELTLWNKGHAVDGDDFQEAIDGTPAAVVLAIDACHSGAILNEPFRNKRLAVLAACGPRESSYYSNPVKGRPLYGYFGAALHAGLSGGATAGRDGRVSVGELARYVSVPGNVASRKQHARIRVPDAVAGLPLTARRA